MFGQHDKVRVKITFGPQYSSPFALWQDFGMQSHAAQRLINFVSSKSNHNKLKGIDWAVEHTPGE